MSPDERGKKASKFNLVTLAACNEPEKTETLSQLKTKYEKINCRDQYDT